MKTSLRLPLLATTALISVSFAAGAQAQTGAPPADESGLDTIIVTAQRREENLQKVPLSVSAFSAEELEAQGTNDVSRLEGRVPGFTFGRSGVDARPAIRGVRTENVGVNGDTTIGFFVDGIYQSRAAQATMGFVDLERVEIQRGPQGTLYGRNTFGGNISIVTAQPELEDYSGAIAASYGSNNHWNVQGVANVPLGKVAAFRLVASREKSDGWVKNVNPLGNNLFDNDDTYARASFLFQPNDDFKATIKYDYSQRLGAGGSAFGYKLVGSYFFTPTNTQLFNATPVILNTRPGNRDSVVDAPLTIDNGVPIFAAGDPYTIDTDQKTFLRQYNKAWTGNVSYDFGPVVVKSITGYTDFSTRRTSDSDFSGNQIAVDYQLTAAKTFSQELQFLSDYDGPLSWVAGAYYFKDKLTGVFINQQMPRLIRNVSPTLVLAQNGAGAYDEQRAKTQSIAGYAQASYEVTEALKLTGGLRYTSDKKDFRFANANSVLPLAGAPPVPQGTAITLLTGGIPESAFGVEGAATNCTYVTIPLPRPGFQCLAANTTQLTGATFDTKTFSEVTWRAGVDYTLENGNLLYASASSGFRSGGFNSGQTGGASQPTFDPEKVKAFEIGSKNRFFDNTLQLNLAAFYNRYSGLQEQRQIPFGATTISIIENSGKARSFGAEAEAVWQPVDAATITFAGAYLNAEYTKYDQVPLPFGTSILVPDASVLAPVVVDGFTISPAGQRRVFAPGYNCGPIPGSPPATPAFGCDLSGKSIPYSPKVSGSVSAQYDFSLGSLGTLTPFAIVQYSSSWYGQPANSVLDRQGSYAKVDLRLTWAYDDRFSVQGYVTNLTDRTTSTRFVYGGGGALQASYAPPRLWGVRADVKF